jgi:hypothetical protein
MKNEKKLGIFLNFPFHVKKIQLHDNVILKGTFLRYSWGKNHQKQMINYLYTLYFDPFGSDVNF